MRKLWLLSKRNVCFCFKFVYANTWSKSPAPKRNCKDLTRAKISALRKEYLSLHRVYCELFCGEKFNGVKLLDD